MASTQSNTMSGSVRINILSVVCVFLVLPVFAVSTATAQESAKEAFAKGKDLFESGQYVEAIALSYQPVLITGETGVGKELIAKSVHIASKREGRFIPVNIAGLDDNVFADTLFGHKRGAFTGADNDRNGLVEAAAHGTLFLDEIGDLSRSSQVKLLRLIQQGEYLRLGSDRKLRSHARIIAATSRSPKELRNGEHFRRDLLYRLKTHSVHLPPLRERMEDIPVLIVLIAMEMAATRGPPGNASPATLHLKNTSAAPVKTATRSQIGKQSLSIMKAWLSAKAAI